MSDKPLRPLQATFGQGHGNLEMDNLIWGWVEAIKKRPGKSLYARATDTGVDPREAAKRLNMDWDSAADIEPEDEREEEVPVPPAVVCFLFPSHTSDLDLEYPLMIKQCYKRGHLWVNDALHQPKHEALWWGERGRHARGYGALYLVTAFPLIIGVAVVLILFYNSLQ
ncbi:hypothetical protein Taro_039175 [Colocasia esculenta]|uniref:Uncharacterized protein n=1 Tax=Colocasia esculenta TaxID=4460 RepID=A0A843WQS7_COLES|nr:hypothetical protein [Colocasia esculenta]